MGRVNGNRPSRKMYILLDAASGAWFLNRHAVVGTSGCSHPIATSFFCFSRILSHEAAITCFFGLRPHRALYCSGAHVEGPSDESIVRTRVRSQHQLIAGRPGPDSCQNVLHTEMRKSGSLVEGAWGPGTG